MKKNTFWLLLACVIPSTSLLCMQPTGTALRAEVSINPQEKIAYQVANGEKLYPMVPVERVSCYVINPQTGENIAKETRSFWPTALPLKSIHDGEIKGSLHVGNYRDTQTGHYCGVQLGTFTKNACPGEIAYEGSVAECDGTHFFVPITIKIVGNPETLAQKIADFKEKPTVNYGPYDQEGVLKLAERDNILDVRTKELTFTDTFGGQHTTTIKTIEGHGSHGYPNKRKTREFEKRVQEEGIVNATINAKLYGGHKGIKRRKLTGTPPETVQLQLQQLRDYVNEKNATRTTQ